MSSKVASDGLRGRVSGAAMDLRSSPQNGQRQAGERTMPERFRIAIIGSGPAGLSAAARAAGLGLTHVLLEKADHLSDTIYKYQKGKHVMATPAQLVLRSDMPFEAGKREKVLAAWDVGAEAVNVRLNA